MKKNGGFGIGFTISFLNYNDCHNDHLWSPYHKYGDNGTMDKLYLLKWTWHDIYGIPCHCTQWMKYMQLIAVALQLEHPNA